MRRVAFDICSALSGGSTAAWGTDGEVGAGVTGATGDGEACFLPNLRVDSLQHVLTLRSFPGAHAPPCRSPLQPTRPGSSADLSLYLRCDNRCKSAENLLSRCLQAGFGRSQSKRWLNTQSIPERQCTSTCMFDPFRLP